MVMVIMVSLLFYRLFKIPIIFVVAFKPYDTLKDKSHFGVHDHINIAKHKLVTYRCTINCEKLVINHKLIF